MVSIHPCVAARHPDARLEIVGSKPTRAMRRLAVEEVTITGWVPSVDPYLDRAAMVVVPLRLGGGMRVKVLETLAAGKALVASPRAVEGLDLVAGRDFIAADTNDEFCRAVCELLEDPVRRAALGHAARAWAEDNLRWDAAVDAYEELYASLSPRPREEAYR
jgi:glycosyltransferase involved in cell wall biosynthesis